MLNYKNAPKEEKYEKDTTCFNDVCSRAARAVYGICGE